MNKPELARQRLLCALLLFCTGLILAACSSGTVKGESPFVQVNSWRIDGSELNLELRLRNVNDEALQLSGVELGVRLANDVLLVQMQQALALSVPGGGFETIRLKATASDSGVALLEELASGALASVAYQLEGSVDSQDEGVLRFSHDGRIYTVPGRPGEFR